MTFYKRFIFSVAITATLALGACAGDTDVDVTADSADVDVNVDTSGANVDTDGDDSVDVSLDGEGVEKLVEAQLILSPGFSGVTVESEGEGMIVLNGTVASADEKTRAETETKAVAGVTSVKNNLTVAP